MMQRTTLLGLLFFFLTLLHAATAQPIGSAGIAPLAKTPEEKQALLDKALETVKWFHSLTTSDEKNAVRGEVYRSHIAPLELIQAAILVKAAKQEDTVNTLLSIFPYLETTPYECFEIRERLEDEGLDTLKTGDAEHAVIQSIRAQADTFLATSLTPVERMALYNNPETALELMKAIAVLSGTGRPQLTRTYLKKFVALDPTPEEAAEIVDAVGSTVLAGIAADRDFAPFANEAVQKIFTAARKHWAEPEAIREAVDRIASGDLHAAADDITVVWRGAEISVPLVIERFATASDDEAKELAALLESLGSNVREALSESLRGNDAKIVHYAAQTLAAMIPPQESPLLFAAALDEQRPDDQREEISGLLQKLLGECPSRDAAARKLYEWALDYRDRRRSLRYDDEGHVEFWNFDEKQNRIVWVTLPLPAAYREYACRYAADAFAVAPESPTIRRLYLQTLFERTAHRTAAFAPSEGDLLALREVIGRLDIEPSVLEEVLSESLQTQQFGAAQIAALLLGEFGKAETLCYVADGANVKPRPLVAATAAPNRHVRFAALESIMKLAPTKPYPGRSLVADAMLWFARGEGRARLVSAAPKQADAMRMTGLFASHGYFGDIAATSAEAMRLAAESPDVDLLVLDDRCKTPQPEAIVREMRRDCRTFDVPVAILSLTPGKLRDAAVMTPLEWQIAADRLSPENPFAEALALVYVPPQTAEDARKLRDDLYFKTGTYPIPAPLRLMQGRRALGWILEIVERGADEPRLYEFEHLEDMATRAIASPGLFYQGIDLAAAIRSASMQAVLAEMAGRQTLDMPVRRRLAEKFTESVTKHGVLLRGRQVQVLYDRYNVAKDESPDSQEILASILDSVEKKTFEKK